MGRKCIVRESRSSIEGPERYPESKNKIIHLQTDSQSTQSRMPDNTRSKTLNRITGELVNSLFVRE
jgi:hypothetical protein